MVHKIDLDAAERARTAKLATAIEIDWHGYTYKLPIEQPMETARHFAKLGNYSDDENGKPGEVGDDGKPVLDMRTLDAHYADGLAVMFCTCEQLPWPDDDHPGEPELHVTECQWVRFLRGKPTRETRQELVRLLNAAYYGGDAKPGEAAPPRSSSKSTSARSKRTGTGTTRKTSQSRSTSGTAATKKAAAKRRS